MDITTDHGFNNALQKNNLPVPSSNCKLEDQYKEALKNYIRPAKTMFAGSFSEVRDFNERLNRTMESKLFIISSRYGLISENEKIIPYKIGTFNAVNLEIMNKKNNFLKDMTNISAKVDGVILLLPRSCIEFLITKKWLQSLASNIQIIAVTSPSLKNGLDNRVTKILPRVGVARIGKTNREIILDILEGN